MKKIKTIAIVIILILTAICASLILYNFFSMKSPDITCKIEILEINTDEIIIYSYVELYNPNSFDIIIKDLIIKSFSNKDETIAKLSIEGGKIESGKTSVFEETHSISFSEITPEEITSKISGVAGFSYGPITKTLPFNFKIITSINDFDNKFLAPRTNISVDFGEITQQSVNITIDLETYNPNTFELALKDLSINVTNDEGEKVGELLLEDLIMAEKTSTIVHGFGTMKIEALNSEKINITFNSKAVATIAGFQKELPINIVSTINAPDLRELLPSNYPTEIVLISDYRASLRGIENDIIFVAKNPNNIDFIAKDIVLTINRIDDKTKTLVCQGIIEDGMLKGNDTTLLNGSFVIPYSKIFYPPAGGKLVPNWLEVSLRTNITVQGLDQYFWVGMVIYQDLNLLKKDEIVTNPAILNGKNSKFYIYN